MSLIHKFYLVEINDFNLLNYEIIYNRLIEKNKTENIIPWGLNLTHQEPKK